MIDKANIEKTNAWPFVEAKKMLRERKSIIDKKGKIIKSKKLDVEGYFESKLKVGDNKTIFMKYGNWTLIILLITSLIFGLILDKIFKNRKKD